MISTKPKFLIEGKIIKAEVFLGMLPVACANVGNEYPDCEIVYQYSHSLCKMRAVDPVVPIGTNCFARSLPVERMTSIDKTPFSIELGGYVVSEDWLAKTPLSDFRDAMQVRILSGDWNKQSETFTWCASGLNVQNSLLLGITIDIKIPNKTLDDRLESLMSMSYCCSEKPYLIDGNNVMHFIMVVPLFFVSNLYEYEVFNDNKAHYPWEPDLWHLAQLENFSLHLSYDTINNSCRYQNAWVINVDGDYIDPEQDDKDDGDTKTRRSTSITKTWSSLRVGDLCVFSYETAESEVCIDSYLIGSQHKTIWQKRRLQQIIDDSENQHTCNEEAKNALPYSYYAPIKVAPPIEQAFYGYLIAPRLEMTTNS